MNKGYLIVFIFFAFFACKNKTAIYSALVISENGDPLEGVYILIEKNGVTLPVTPDTLTGQDIKKINKGEMFAKIVTDSSGKFNVGFIDSYIIRPPEYKIHLVKENYKEVVIDIKWIADIENKIILCRQ